jgi:hypothetical protein
VNCLVAFTSGLKAQLHSVNDILSLKKEVGMNTVDSAVPLLSVNCDGPQEAVDFLYHKIGKAIETLDRAADELYVRYDSDQALQSTLKRFVDGCRENCTGNLNWSFQCQRYALQTTQIDNFIVI